MEKFSNISGFCRAASNLIMCIRSNAHQTLLMLRVWWSVLQQSQQMYPPKHCRQQLLTTCRGVLGTHNRMSNHQLVTYHRLPTAILPVVNQEDELLINMLFQESHVTENGVHLNKDLTTLKLRTGFFGTHIPATGKLVKKMIEACVSCKTPPAGDLP